MSFAFFRKYNKWILAFGGSLLMVLFLVPATATRMGRQSADDIVRGTVGEREVTQAQYQQAEAELRLLANLHREMARTLPQVENAAMVWLLAQIEAEQQGLHASMAEAQSVLNSMQVDPQNMAKLRQTFGTTDQGIVRTLQHWLIYQRLARMIQQPMRASEPELRHFARDVQSSVSVDVVPIPATRYLTEVGQPTEQQITDQFEQYRDMPAGANDPYGFGYRLPARVQLEWIAVPMEAARAAARVDDVEAQRYYLDNPDEFVPGAPGDPQASDPNAHSDADPTEPLPYEVVREHLMDRIERMNAQARQSQAIRFIRAEMERPLRRYPRDPNSGYLQIPDDAVLPSLASIAQQVADNPEFGFEPRVVGVEDTAGGWVAVRDLATREGLGQSMLLVGSGGQMQAVPTPVYVGSAHELNPPADHPLRATSLQVGLPSQPVVDRGGTRYVFRIRAAEPSRAPRDLATVRERVVADLVKLQAYAFAKERGQRYAEKAAAEGLDAVVEMLGEGFQVLSITDFTRRQFNPQQSTRPIVPNLEIVGQSEQFVDGVFDLAGPLSRAEDPNTVPPSERTGVVPVDRTMTAYVTQITDYQSMTQGQYAQARPLLMQLVLQTQAMAAQREAGNPFTLEAISRRVGYEPDRGDAEDEDANDGQ